MRAAADGVAEVPFRECTALVRPDAFSGAEDTEGKVSGKQPPSLAPGAEKLFSLIRQMSLVDRAQGNKHLFPSGRGKLCSHVGTITLENTWSDVQ